MASPLLAQVNEKPVMKGWVTKVCMYFDEYEHYAVLFQSDIILTSASFQSFKVKLGKSKRLYCILRGKYLCYYKSENDQVRIRMAC